VNLGHSKASSNSDGDWKDYTPPLLEKAEDCIHGGAKKFFSSAKAAYDRGVWQIDSGSRARNEEVDPESIRGGTTMLESKPGIATLRMAYFFFSGVKRKASAAEQLKRRCQRPVMGFIVFEIEVLVGRKEHDLLDSRGRFRWPETFQESRPSLAFHGSGELLSAELRREMSSCTFR